MKYLITLLIGISSCLVSQESVKPRIFGNIIDAETREPIANANIFVSNSSIGTASDKNGYFELRNLPYGRYEIIASVIGYEMLNAKIGIYNDNRRNLRFEMYKQPIQLPEVIVSAKGSWKRKRNLSRFRKALLGTSQNGKNSYITNEEVIRFNEDVFGYFIAYADEPIKIVNNSLGYDIHYVLEDFELSGGYVKYTGYPHFIEKIATTYHDSVDWFDNRIDTYLGSFRHFLTTICENFELTSGDTTKRPIVFKWGDAIRHSVKVTYGDITLIEEQGFYILQIDSLKNIRKRATDLYEVKPISVGNRQLVNTNCFLTETNNPNEMYLQFDGSLEVTYSKDLFPFGNRDDSKGTSWIKIIGDSTILDKHGRYFDIYAIKTIGLWSKERVADMLPFDYSIGEE
jgi:hypothetical protein